MDPVCHTLVGTTLAQAGLGRRTTLATATLVIGANLPDVDALTYFAGDALVWRRGWTHGVIAMAVWPFVLAGAMWMWDLLLRRLRPARAQPPPDVWALVKLGALAVATHPTLDFMNNYGMRWLMPFDGTWFYGDALFIVDPWIWAALAFGTLAVWQWGRRPPRAATRTWPAHLALGVVSAYALVMLSFGHLGRPVARDLVVAAGMNPVALPMVAPVPFNPLRRLVVADLGDEYYVSGLRWVPAPHLIPGGRFVPKGRSHPAVARAAETPDGRGFLSWSRLPFFTVTDAGDAFMVTLDDVRYAPPGGSSWAARTVRVPK